MQAVFRTFSLCREQGADIDSHHFLATLLCPTVA